MRDLSKIEEFAALSWRLDNPFVNRTELLAQEGLDEAEWKRVVDGWLARFAAEGPALTAQFSNSYRADYEAFTTRSDAAAAIGWVEAFAPQSTPSAFTRSVAEPWRAAAREVPLSAAASGSAASGSAPPPALVLVPPTPATTTRIGLSDDDTLLPSSKPAATAAALPFQPGVPSIALMVASSSAQAQTPTRTAPARAEDSETLLPDQVQLTRPATPFAEPPREVARVEVGPVDCDADTILPGITSVSVVPVPVVSMETLEVLEVLEFEAYAQLRAVLMDNPEAEGEAEAEILRRFHIRDGAHLEQIQAAWRDRFAADPPLRDRWLELLLTLRRPAGPRA